MRTSVIRGCASTGIGVGELVDNDMLARLITMPCLAMVLVPSSMGSASEGKTNTTVWMTGELGLSRKARLQ